MRITPRLTSMTAGLAIGVTAAVATACAIGASLYSVHHFKTLIEDARTTALAQGELIRAGLEHQMLENDRSLIARMIETFGKQPSIENVVLVDRTGVVRFSSAPITTPGDFTLGSPTCQACHQYPPAQRASSRIIDTRGGSVLRTVIPVRNQPACYRCHDPSHHINGILILDVNAQAIRAGMDRDLRWMVAGSGVITLLLVAGIAVVVRVVVLRRLQRFETTARLIASGDLKRRVPTGGSDTISWLASEFNTMADSMTGLLNEVHGQQKRLETVINSIDDGIVVLDPNRRVIAANDAFLRRTGRARDQVLGRSCADRNEGICAVADCPTLACFESHERQVRICERRTADGALRWEEVHASPLFDPASQLVQVVEVWRDISDRRAAEAHLAESHRLASLGLLASGFSHELNTPLATVLTCVEGILRDLQASGTAAPGLSRIGESASIAREQLLRCRGITQQFLRMSRGQSTSIDIVDVQATLDAAARLVEPTARAHGVRIRVERIAAHVQVRADEGELQHVIINLILNAIQASPDGAEIRLGVSGDDPVRIHVIDDGCGIAVEHQARIFEPFFGLRPGGTGLGLFLSLSFVRQWGGSLAVTSAPGAGSTFEVVLPAAMGAAASKSA
jgi:PAS domain S-box-containing protein